MVGSGAGKGQTAKPTNALLLLALHAALLLHIAAAAEKFRCPQGTLGGHKPIPIRWNDYNDTRQENNVWMQPWCSSQNLKEKSCCKWYSTNKTYECAHGKACEGPDGPDLCVPYLYKPCCPGVKRVKNDFFPKGGFVYPKETGYCTGIKSAVVCPERKAGSVGWKSQKTTEGSSVKLSCCKYNATGDREYTLGTSEEWWDGTDRWKESTSSDPADCKAGDCVPEDGKRCCAKPDGSGGFVKQPECPKVHWPRCPMGKAGHRPWSPSDFIDCPTGCCVYDKVHGFSCGAATNGKCVATGGKQVCTKDAAKKELHCCPVDKGGFEGNMKGCSELTPPGDSDPWIFRGLSQDFHPRPLDFQGSRPGFSRVSISPGSQPISANMKCCPDLFKDRFIKVQGDCPEMGCPTEVARQPRREDSTAARGKSAWAHGDCCVKDGHETSKWAKSTNCKASAVKNGDACKPKGNQKCCFHTEGKKLTVEELMADCDSPTKPKCPKGDGRGKPTSCGSGCCVYDYGANKFGCADKGPDGLCPPAKENEQTCTAGRGKNDACCAAVKNGEPLGGFDSENAGKCASPIIKCGKAAGAEPEPCADGTFKCCVGNQCSKDCSAPEGRGKGEKCTPVTTTNDLTKCCVNEYGDGYAKLPNGEACPEKRAPFGCPLEVAEEPETKTCGRVRGQCCVLEGPGQASCASGHRCEDEGEICQPDSDHKCCFSPNGKALLIRKTADPCPAKPPIRCKDQKAVKIAECEEKEAEKEACKRAVEKCLVDEGVSEAGAAGGKDCEEAWAECERSQTGAAEAHGPSLRLLAPATLLLLLPH